MLTSSLANQKLRLNQTNHIIRVNQIASKTAPSNVASKYKSTKNSPQFTQLQLQISEVQVTVVNMDEKCTYIEEIGVQTPHDSVLEFIERARQAVGEEDTPNNDAFEPSTLQLTTRYASPKTDKETAKARKNAVPLSTRRDTVFSISFSSTKYKYQRLYSDHLQFSLLNS